MVITPASRRACTPEELAYATMFGIAPHLAHLLHSMRGGRPIQAFYKYVSNLRDALPCEAIDTVRGGYQLTDIGQAACRKAEAEFYAWIATAQSKGKAA